MNQLAIIRKHLKAINVAYDAISVPGTKKRAGGMIREETMRYEGMEGPRTWALSQNEIGDDIVTQQTTTVVLAVPEAERGVSLGGGDGSRVDGEMPVEAARKPEIYKGNPVLEPVTDSEWEVGEPGPGVYANEIEGDTHEPERDIPPAPAEMRDGFPLKATIIVSSRCINPKLLAGRLGDGRSVSIERGFRQWKVGDSVECELLRSGGQPLYRQLNTRT